MPDDPLSTTALGRAISSQPDELRRLLTAPLAHDSVERLKQARRIWIVGTGSSYHAAELGAEMLHDAGRAAHAISSMRFVNWAPPINPMDALVVVSHNAGAETSYASAAYTMGMGGGLRVVAVTRRGGGLTEALETVDQERSETHSVSYTSALLVLARLAQALEAPSCAPETLARIPDAVQAAIDDPRTQGIEQPDRALLLVGEGPAAITAREGALKLREASRLLAEGYDVEYLLHGSAVPLGSSDRLVALTPPDTDGLTEAVARAAGSQRIPVSRLHEPSDLPPILAQIPLTVRLQLLALRYAAERRKDPDVVIEGAWSNDELWRIGSQIG
jgi:glutamine---fructose-6-phosphate transaminase (isomerizing)